MAKFGRNAAIVIVSGVCVDQHMVSEAALIAINAGICSILLVAGTGKAVSPHQLVQALHGLTSSQKITPTTVRALAAVEICAGLLLAIPATRLWGAGLAGLLGLGFVAAGVVGIVRRSATACGCFGSAQGRPLGGWNAGLGILLAAVPLLNGGTDRTVTDPFVASTLSTAVAMVAVALWVHRRLVRDLTRPLPTTPASR
jgi:methylamine utilization protein MauE